MLPAEHAVTAAPRRREVLAGRRYASSVARQPSPSGARRLIRQRQAHEAGAVAVTAAARPLKLASDERHVYTVRYRQAVIPGSRNLMTSSRRPPPCGLSADHVGGDGREDAQACGYPDKASQG